MWLWWHSSVVLGLQMCGEELEPTGDGPFDTWTLPSRVRKILWLQALKYPHGVCAHLIHTKSSPRHWTSEKKKSPQNQKHLGLLGSIYHRLSTGLGQAPMALLLGRSHFTFVSVITGRFGSFGQLPPNSFDRCPCSTAWSLFWQPPTWSCLQTVLHLVSKAWGTESSLCF